MTTRSLKYGSGKGVFVGQSVIYPIPIPLNPSEYFGAALVAEDGQFYYSNGTEWLVPVEDNLISRPNALVPFTVDEQTQLRLTPYRSPGGIDQLGAIFEISTNGLNFTGSVTRIVEGVGTNMYQLLYPEDGFDPGEVVLWRAAYVGVGGVQSSFSLPYRQTFPELITTPTAVTRDNAISGTVTITDFESAGIFGYQYHETQVEFYEVGDVPGVDAPFHAMTTQAGPITTIPVPPLLTATQYVWRARYGGKVTSVAPTVYSPWTFPRNVFVGAASIILQYDLNLALSRTVFVPLGGGTTNNPLNVSINWGDGITETFTTAGVKSHVYAAGYTQPTVQVIISGRLSWYGTDLTTINQQGLTRVENIGFSMGLTSLRGAFRNTGLALSFITENVPETVTDMSQMFVSSTCAADMRNFDTRNVQNMTQMFQNSLGVGPNCENWDVRSVTNVRDMFTGSAFNSPFSVGNWLSLTSMERMFYDARGFDQPIDYWDVSRITNMNRMFGKAYAGFGSFNPFNQDVSNWDVSLVTDMSYMFGIDDDRYSQFGMRFNNGGSAGISGWNVTNVTNFTGMFQGNASFNQPIGTWNMAGVTTINRMFHGASAFNRPLNAWDVSTITDMSRLFLFNRLFDQPLNNWNVSNVTDMSFMFCGCPFNQPIGNWNVSNVRNFSGMFATGATNAQSQFFNQDLSNWNVSSATNMSYMFGGQGAGGGQVQPFNNGGSPGINNWDVSNVTNMEGMFGRGGDEGFLGAFNQPIFQWNVSNVVNMRGMFAARTGASFAFNQDISTWNLNLAVDLAGFMENYRGPVTRAFSQENYSRLLTGWANKIADVRNGPFIRSTTFSALTYNNTVYAPTSRFTNGVAARAYLVGQRALSVTGATTPDADGSYLFNPSTGTYVKSNGWYFLKSGAVWTLFSNLNVAQSQGTGEYPWNAPSWTGVLLGSVVLSSGAGWTITGDVAA